MSETRAAYSKAKTAADEAANALESSYAAAKTGVVAINAKALEALRANVDANFDFVKSAFAVKNVADYVALHGEFTRKQIDAITGQTKEIGALAQKLATETAEPIKEQVAKTLQDRRLRIPFAKRRASSLAPLAAPPRLGAALLLSPRRPAAARRIDRARALQRQGFDTSFPAVAVRAAIAQLVRALDCGSRGPPFEPGWRYQLNQILRDNIPSPRRHVNL